MLSKDTSILSLLAAVAFASIVGSGGVKAYTALKERAKAQVAAVVDLREWKRQYSHLIPVEERWNTSLGVLSDAKDLLTIHGLLSAKAPYTNPDTLLVDRITRLTVDDRDLGAQKVCVASAGAGMLFTEKTFPELIFGLQALSARVDVEVGMVSLSQDKGVAKAMVSPVCLLLRDSVTQGAPL